MTQNAEYLRHSGKTGFITGGGSGIGRQTALTLASQGAAMVVTDVNAETAAETVSRISEAGGRAIAAVVDVRSRSQIQDAVRLGVESFGEFDLLVNNAGLVTDHSLNTLTEDAWDLVLDVNLKGQWLVAQEISTSMIRSGGGAIVNLSTVEASVVVTSGNSAQPHYNAAKGGVPMLTKALAVELAPNNIRVNCVAPGPIATDFFDLEGVTSPEAKSFMDQRLLVQRIGEPDDIARAISWLLSEEASWIDGIQLPVDGGWLTR